MKQKKIHIKKYSKFLFFYWLLIIMIISSIPQLFTPKIGTTRSKTIRLDYVIHIFEFSILALLFMLWQMNQKKKLTSPKVILYITFGLCVALLTELYQILIPGRKFNVLDSMYKSIGFITVFLLFYLTSMGKKSKVANR